MDEFEKALDGILKSYKQKIRRLNKMKKQLNIKQLEYQLTCLNDSLNIMTYSLLQEEGKNNEEIKKTNN